MTWLRVFFRVLDMALTAVWAFKVRGIFTALSTAMGVSALTLIVASVDGANRTANRIVDMFGPDAVFIIGGDQTRALNSRQFTLTTRDARVMATSLPGAYQLVGMRSISSPQLKYGAQNYQTALAVGTTENYASVWNWPLVEGRDITEEDVRTGAKVALIGETPARELFGDENPLGRTILLNNMPTQIIGRLEFRGTPTGGGTHIDDRVIIPISTLTQRFRQNRNYFRAIRIKFLETEYMDAHVENTRSLLRSLHNLKETDRDDFTILTAAEVLKFMSMFKGSLYAFLGVTAGVAILAGGFVLANLFFLSVSERSREIGLKKALGAKSGDILRQFLVEAVLLTLLGGALGVAFGLGLGRLLSNLGVLDIEPSFKILGLAMAASLAVGLTFGLKPAKKAAALAPIEAMRGE